MSNVDAYLLKHGDVVTLRTQSEGAGGQEGWLYIDRDEQPQISHAVSLPITDRKFMWQVLKPYPQKGGGNQNPDYVTEGDHIFLKSVHNDLLLAFYGNHCGFNSTRAVLGQEIAMANYQQQGDGGQAAIQLIGADGGVSEDKAVVKGHRAYALKYTKNSCYLSMPFGEKGATSGGQGLAENFIIMPPSGTLEELEFQAGTPQHTNMAGLFSAGTGQYTEQASIMATGFAPLKTPSPAWEQDLKKYGVYIGGGVVILIVLIALIILMAK